MPDNEEIYDTTYQMSDTIHAVFHSVTVNGNTAQAVRQSDGRRKIVIPNIPAHMLGEVYSISATTDNDTATYSVSALSYVRAVLNSDSFNDTAKNAVASFYH